MSFSTPIGCLCNTPSKPIARLLWCHGAGAPMDSDFMTQMAELLCEQQLAVVRFEFPYMAERRTTGKRRPPNPMPVVLDSLKQQVDYWSCFDHLPLFVAGKSMGGRAAAMLDKGNFRGAIALGYPLHPVGKPDKLRLEPLVNRLTPLLVLQGDRDPLGSRDEFERLFMDKSIELKWFSDGDHDLKPRRKSGFTQVQYMQSAATLVRQFIANLLT